MALPLRDDAPTTRTPWVTIALILVNVVVFLFLQPPLFQRQTSTRTTRPYEQYEEIVEAERYLWTWGAVPCEIMSGKRLADRPRSATATGRRARCSTTTRSCGSAC